MLAGWLASWLGGWQAEPVAKTTDHPTARPHLHHHRVFVLDALKLAALEN